MGPHDQYALPPREETPGVQVLDGVPAPAPVATRPGSHWQSTPATLDPQLVGRLFAAPERWGWEYVAPQPIQPYPHLAAYPTWVEPPEPDLSALYGAARRAKAKLPSRLGWGIPLVLIGLLSMFAGGGGAVIGLLLMAAGGLLAGVAIAADSTAKQELQRAVDAGRRDRDSKHRKFLEAVQTWDRRIAEHNEAERVRFATVLLHYPLELRGMPSRVDVVGGTPVSWAALLATMGTSTLTGGSAILLLDLSARDVGSGLARLAQEQQVAVRAATVPDDLERIGLLDRLDAREVADVLAEAMASARAQADHADLRARLCDLLHTVTRRLDQPITLARVAAGIEVLRTTYDLDGDGPLSAGEVLRLTQQVDAVDKTERVRDELRFIDGQLGLLAHVAARSDPPPAGASLWEERGLTVLRTEARSAARKDIADRVVFQLVMHELADRRVGPEEPMLVVAGADHLGRESLERMVRQAWDARVRLVYLFEHLREDTAEILGGADSATVIMRLGNGREAATAAEFVGKGHSLVLSQITRQVGRTVTDGGSTSTGGQEGYGRTEGSTGDEWGWMTGTSSTFSENWSKSWQEAKNWSQAQSETDGTTTQRSYEFTVEPTVIQSLEPTAFVLVDSRSDGRRVVAGDCFPGMVLVDRVSTISR